MSILSSSLSDESRFSLHDMLAWTRRALGGDVVSDDSDIVAEAGRLAARHYHTLEHFEAIANAWQDHVLLGTFSSALHLHEAQEFDVIKAWIMRAGAHHDVIYLNADGLVLPPRIQNMLAMFVEQDDAGQVVTTCDQLPEHATHNEQCVFALARIIFEKTSEKKLGTNEYLSAVYAGLQGLNDGLQPHDVLAEMTMIAGTIPFQSADYIDALRERLHKALALVPTQVAPSFVHNVMAATAQLANYDVLSFATHSADEFLRETDLLLQESSGGRGITLHASAHSLHFMEQLQKNMHDGDACVFHAFAGFPCEATLSHLHEKAALRIADCIAYLKSSTNRSN